MVEVTLDANIDVLYKEMYETETFFQVVCSRAYGNIHNYSLSDWNAQGQRKMHYEFSKTIAFSKYNIVVDQDQLKCPWSVPNVIYGVDQVSRSSGIMYTDYFHLDLHTRFEALESNKTRMTVILNQVWEKSCILKSKYETETFNGTKAYYETLIGQLKSLGHPNKHGLIPSTDQAASSKVEDHKNYLFDERTILIAFILVIVTLLIITAAMFKLAGSILALSDRLINLEVLLEQCIRKPGIKVP